MSNSEEIIIKETVTANTNKQADIDFIKEQLSALKSNLDQYHKKSAIVNGARSFFTDLVKKYKCSDPNIKGLKNDEKVLENYQVKHNGFDIVLTIKSYSATSIISSDVSIGTTIQRMNESIEKSKKYFGQDFMIFIRDYFCLKLITSATDHRLDSYSEEGEFSFRFSVPSARLNIELLILN